MNSILLIPDNIVHKGTYRPPFGTWGSLTFDFAIAHYTDTLFLKSYLYFTLQVTRGLVHPRNSDPPTHFPLMS